MKNKEYKCLVIMHNQLNDKTNNGKTVSSMISKIPKKNRALLYITKTSNSENDVNTSFLITEKEQMFKFINYKSNDKETLIGARKNQKNFKIKIIKQFMPLISRMGIILWARNLFWSKNRWESERLNTWINKFSPDIIFVLPGYIEGVMDCAMEYSNKLGIPLVTFVTDDYFSDIKTTNIIKRKLYKKLYEKYNELMKKSQLHYVIGEKMAKKYDKIFSSKNIPIMNNVKIKKSNNNIKISENPKFIFAGNIGIDRLSQLLLLGKQLNKLNEKYNLKCSLDIYTPMPISDKELLKINTIKSCKYKGSVYGDKLDAVIDVADILVHVESFKKKYKVLLETALSTKIPEYMNSGKQILMIGPEYSESIDYLDRNKAGYCIKDITKDFYEDIYKMLNNKRIRLENIKNAYSCVLKNHSLEKNANEINKKFLELINSRKEGNILGS